MAEVIQVQPEGIMVTIKFPLHELVLLKQALDIVEIKAHMEIEDQKKAAEYVTGSFYPMIKDIVEDLTHGS